ncbi:MAG: LemA family protein [Oligoflexus sp.]
MGSWILLGIAVVLVFYMISIYNKLISLRNRFQNAFSQIDVQLKRRYDLIPNLVETAKAFLKHERETLEAVIQARNAASTASHNAAKAPGDPKAMGQLLGAEAHLTGMMGRFFALSEAYPDLKSDANMRQLSEELTSTENKIAFARQAYNDAVMHYNTARESFPNILIANPFHFQEASLFELESPKERQAVKVNFN